MEQLEYMVDKPWCFGRDNQFNQFEFIVDPWVFVNRYDDDYIYYEFEDHCYPIYDWGW